MVNNYSIRDMQESDLPMIISIENESFVSPWSEADILNELTTNNFSQFKVICLNNIAIGFVDYWVTFDSATICQIAIDKMYRKNGLASLLIKELEDDCYAKRVRIITLEVRKSNQIAINFYLKHNFKVAIEKPNYYSNGEDALYMIKEVKIDG